MNALVPLPPERLRDICETAVYDDWAYVFGEQDGSTSGPVGFTRADVAELYYAEDGEPDGAAWMAAGRLHDGRYFTVQGECDYTGWG